MNAAHELLRSDLASHRVWEFADDMEGELPDETYMRPVEAVSVDLLSGRVASTHLALANGQRLLALLGNIELVVAGCVDRVSNQMKTWPNNITGPNAGGPRQFPIEAPSVARFDQYCRFPNGGADGCTHRTHQGASRGSSPGG